MNPRSQSYTVHFPSSDHANINVCESLSTSLTLQNSPVLFGCRTGICGTCLVIAEGDMLPPDSEEQEVLEVLAPAQPKARLACQIKPTGDLFLMPLSS